MLSFKVELSLEPEVLTSLLVVNVTGAPGAPFASIFEYTGTMT